MKRFISLISILTCLVICLGITGCAKASTGRKRTSRNTISLNDLYSSINGESVIGGSSFNNTSNSSNGTVNGSTPIYQLGEVVEGNGSSTNNNGNSITNSYNGGNGENGGNGGNGNANNGGQSIIGGNGGKGLAYLLERTISCSELNPLESNYYDLYFKDDGGTQVIANKTSLPDLCDGDELRIGNEYTFVYSTTEDKWQCVKSPVKSVEGYYKTDAWQQVHMVSKELQGKVSEGCQWLQHVEFSADPDAGETAYLSVDVTMPYKTTDGGKTWTPVGLGLGASGEQCMATDPKNANHVILVGSQSAGSNNPKNKNGIHMSLNGGKTWEHTYYWCIHSPRTYVDQIVFDESSYDAAKDMCMTIYWSSEDNTVESKAENKPMLHKSTDGGKTWSVVNENFGSCHLAINPDGTLYAGKFPSYLGTSTGFDMETTTVYKSTDGGKNFTALNIKNVRSFTTIPSKPKSVYIAAKNGLFISNDQGSTFTKLNNGMFPTTAQMLAVSCDGQNMVTQAFASQGGGRACYSNDGGVTWAECDKLKNSIAKDSFLPLHPRIQVTSFSSSNPKLALMTYGDTVIRSEDGGKTWVNSNYGFNGVCTFRIINNVNNNNLLFVPIQDYNGAYSTDGGESFTYVEWSGGPAGMAYGGYMIDENTMFTVWTEHWLDKNLPRYIYTTFDGGKTINRTKDYPVSLDADVISTGSIKDKNVAFVGDMRTGDGAKTFQQMNNVVDKTGKKVEGGIVMGVWCVDYESGTFYGRDNKGYLVYSDDEGVTFKQFAILTPGTSVRGLDCYKDTVYLATIKDGRPTLQKTSIEAQGKFTTVPNPVQNDKRWRCNVQVDKKNGTLYFMHTGTSTPKDANTYSIWRSEDGGKSWVPLSIKMGENGERLGNPYTELYPHGSEAYHIAINYTKNEVIVAFPCRGMWKIGRV